MFPVISWGNRLTKAGQRRAAPNDGADTTILPAELSSGPANQTLTATLYSNSQTFYAETVGRGAVDLAVSLYSNTEAFYGPVVAIAATSQGLSQADRFNNTEAFYAPSVGVGPVTLTPSLYSSSQTFYVPEVGVGSVSVYPSLYANDQTFYTQSVGVGAVDLAPSLVTNSVTFYPLVIDQTGGTQALLAPMFENVSEVYAPATGAVLIAELIDFSGYATAGYVEPGYVSDNFYIHQIDAPVEVKHGGDDAYHRGWDKAAWKKKQKRDELITETIEATYRKLMGIEPEPEVVAVLKKEAKQSKVEQDYTKELQFIEWLSEQIAAIQEKRHLEELDDEETLLLLL